jgi:predicted nucleic acid-binding protein
MKSLVVLDNEAVQALGSASHPKHRRALAFVRVVVQRKRRAVEVALAVPTTVRVEAGWDRTAAAWALLNRLRVADEALGPAQANLAAQIRATAQVSVADAHLGAVIQASEAERLTVLTSDRADIVAVAGRRRANVVRI